MDFEARRRVARRERIMELGERASGEADDAHHAVREAGFGHARARRHRADAFGLIAKHKAQRVRIMDRDIEDHTTACSRIFDAPAL
jgi:hypothetical protein